MLLLRLSHRHSCHCVASHATPVHAQARLYHNCCLYVRQLPRQLAPSLRLGPLWAVAPWQSPSWAWVLWGCGLLGAARYHCALWVQHFVHQSTDHGQTPACQQSLVQLGMWHMLELLEELELHYELALTSAKIRRKLEMHDRIAPAR